MNLLNHIRWLSGTFTGTLRWLPTFSFNLTLPPTPPAVGSYLSNTNAANELGWTRVIAASNLSADAVVSFPYGSVQSLIATTAVVIGRAFNLVSSGSAVTMAVGPSTAGAVQGQTGTISNIGSFSIVFPATAIGLAAETSELRLLPGTDATVRYNPASAPSWQLVSTTGIVASDGQSQALPLNTTQIISSRWNLIRLTSTSSLRLGSANQISPGNKGQTLTLFNANTVASGFSITLSPGAGINARAMKAPLVLLPQQSATFVFDTNLSATDWQLISTTGIAEWVPLGAMPAWLTVFASGSEVGYAPAYSVNSMTGRVSFRGSLQAVNPSQNFGGSPIWTMPAGLNPAKFLQFNDSSIVLSAPWAQGCWQIRSNGGIYAANNNTGTGIMELSNIWYNI